MTVTETRDLVAEIEALYPGLAAAGLTEVIVGIVRDEDIDDPALIVAAVRRTTQWANAFPGIKRPDGTMRMNESQFLTTMDDYRERLNQYGLDGRNYTVNQLSAFVENEISPNELGTRLDTYSNIRRSGREIRDAFYVYAGVRLSDDDLYNYVVYPTSRANFDEEYTRNTVGGVDYDTFITRATEAGLDRVADELDELERQGVAVGNAAAVIRNLDVEFAKQMTDLLYTGGQSGKGFLNLEQLTTSFELALIGGAAAEQGLKLPGQERVEAIRQAGINRQQALAAYSKYASDRTFIQGQVQRLNEGRGRFTQADFEEAVFLQRADERQLLERAAAKELSLGNVQGAPSFSSDRGRLVQRGFRAPFS